MATRPRPSPHPGRSDPRPGPVGSLLRAALPAALAIVVAACAGPGGPTPDPGVLRVVATTTVLADLVANVGGSRVAVSSLVPPGTEVHTFDPSPGDVARVAAADVVVLNGLGLDEWAEGLIEGSGTSATVVELGEDLEGVEYLTGEEHEDEGSAEPDDDHGAVNPHLWLNVAYARLYVDRIAETLAAADPAHAAAYAERAETYGARLDALHESIRERMAALPGAHRRIVSFHEAFPYFAAAYDLEIVGVVVEAPGQDPSAGQIAALVAAIRASGARAVFSEVQFNDRLARVIAEEAGVRVESGLHNDSLGAPPADSYVGMMELNADLIEAALR